MKMIVKGFLFSTLALGFAACSSGGWSASEEAGFMEECERANSIDCKCALEKTKKAYPNCSDFNKNGATDEKLAQDLVDGCMK